MMTWNRRQNHALILLTNRSRSSENIATDLSNEPDANRLPSQFHPTEWTYFMNIDINVIHFVEYSIRLNLKTVTLNKTKLCFLAIFTFEVCAFCSLDLLWLLKKSWSCSTRLFFVIFLTIFMIHESNENN